jgi:hypothetical protein
MLEALLGMLVGAFFIIRVEEFRKPCLKLVLLPTRAADYPEGRPAKRAHVITLQAFNQVLPWWAKWMSRNAAQQCRGAITFHHLDGQDIFGRAMPVKWVRTPEALPLPIQLPNGNLFAFLVDPERLMRDPRIDIAPGEAAELDVVVRFDGDSECYGWNMDSYKSNPPWRNPAWKLPVGRFLIRVTVFSGDQSCSGVFRLINDVPTDAFRLEPKQRTDRVIV